MKKKDSDQPGMKLPGENQDPNLEKDLPGAEKKQPPAPGNRNDPGNKKDINDEDKEPVDERSENL